MPLAFERHVLFRAGSGSAKVKRSGDSALAPASGTRDWAIAKRVTHDKATSAHYFGSRAANSGCGRAIQSAMINLPPRRSTVCLPF